MIDFLIMSQIVKLSAWMGYLDTRGMQNACAVHGTPLVVKQRSRNGPPTYSLLLFSDSSYV